MKLDVIFKVQSLIENNRAIPSDIHEILDEMYFSKSKGVHIRLGDMDITHFVRVVIINQMIVYLTRYMMLKRN